MAHPTWDVRSTLQNPVVFLLVALLAAIAEAGARQPTLPGTHRFPANSQGGGGSGGSRAGSSRPTPNSELSKYVGDWAGEGWGWEVRFKQRRRDFVNQVTGGRGGALRLGDAAEGVIMSLMVKHGTRFYFTVDESGSMSGEGEITYDLYPNLCGVAVLTRQVNEAINFMDKIAMIYKIGAEIGARAVERFNREWYDEEAKLARTMEEFGTIGETLSKGGSLPSPVDPKSAREARLRLQALLEQQHSDDVRRIVQAIIYNRCGNGAWKLTGGIPCTLLELPPGAGGEGGSLGKAALSGALDATLDYLGDRTKEKFQSLNLMSQKEEAACTLGAGSSTVAGTKVGPATKGELAADMGASLSKAAIDMAAGSPPVGLLLSIPGVTQIQYWYKGLANGPESRRFKIKGRLEASGGPKLYLEMDGDVLKGDKRLWVEYMVNYRKEKHPFPAWSPFLEDPGDVPASGTQTILERVTVTEEKVFTDKATGKKKTVKLPQEETKAREVIMSTPFATFDERGKQRNGVKVWHEYEYYWNAHKVTQLPGT